MIRLCMSMTVAVLCLALAGPASSAAPRSYHHTPRHHAFHHHGRFGHWHRGHGWGGWRSHHFGPGGRGGFGFDHRGPGGPPPRSDLRGAPGRGPVPRSAPSRSAPATPSRLDELDRRLDRLMKDLEDLRRDIRRSYR